MSQQAPPPPRAARLDALDGIRTIAVFLVVLFHVAAPGMAAGFIGVDVFFVLSGYLITTGLVSGLLKRESVDLVRFWTRRLRRLMPAAMLVVLVVLLWSWTMAPAYRRPVLGSDAFHTVVYLANWHFMTAGSYFNDDGNQSPLLHMWSLAVEEQFYLLWPLLVFGCLTLARRHRGDGSVGRKAVRLLTAVTVLLLLGSAILLAVLTDPTAPDRAYMGTDTKAFEPLLGALAALLVSRPAIAGLVRRHARLLGWLGVVTMVVLFSRAAGPSAGYFRGEAFVFCLGTALLVLAAGSAPDWWLSRALAWGPMSYLGRISYGIYLWHWPLAVWLGAHAHFSWWRAAAVILLTVALAAASYHLYEQPILNGRWSGWFTTRRTVGLAAAMMLFTSLLAAPLGGTPLTPLARAVLPSKPLDRNAWLVVGDSVPKRLLPVLAPAGEAAGITVDSASMGGCSPLGVHQRISADDVAGERCPQVRQSQSEALVATNPATVVWWSRYEVADRYQGDQLLTPATPAFWQAQRRDFEESVDRLTVNGATLVVVLTEPPGVGMRTRCSARTCVPFLQRLVVHDDYRRTWNAMVTEMARSDRRLRTVTMDDVVCNRPPTPSATYGSALCDDTVSPGRVGRPDGSHFDNELVGSKVSAALLQRVGAATGR
ncbi:acyltransferase family protein [Luteococcus peritonei]|uniref:Acyltransferase family protein n=1 Tax=Luteococcus peritonei TaxID=88874 RepID=A0ABW4RVT6_9ACTN